LSCQAELPFQSLKKHNRLLNGPLFHLPLHPSNIYCKEPFLNKDFRTSKRSLSDQGTACAVEVVIKDKNCFVNCFVSSTENFLVRRGPSDPICRDNVIKGPLIFRLGFLARPGKVWLDKGAPGILASSKRDNEPPYNFPRFAQSASS